MLKESNIRLVTAGKKPEIFRIQEGEMKMFLPQKDNLHSYKCIRHCEQRLFWKIIHFNKWQSSTSEVFLSYCDLWTENHSQLEPILSVIQMRTSANCSVAKSEGEIHWDFPILKKGFSIIMRKMVPINHFAYSMQWKMKS